MSGDFGLPDFFLYGLNPVWFSTTCETMNTDRSVNIGAAPPARVRRPEDRASEITRAALDLVVTRGFAATKLEDVAKEALRLGAMKLPIMTRVVTRIAD